MNDNEKRIVITGIGVVSPIGIGKEAYWDALTKGKSKFNAISLFDVSGYKVKTAGEVVMNEKNEELCRSSFLLRHAVTQCLKDARIEISPDDSSKTGLVVGSTLGTVANISAFDQQALTEGPKFANPSLFPFTVGNAPANNVAIQFQIKGLNSTISTGMCAGLDALDYGIDFLRLNRVKKVVVGGVESLNEQIFFGYYKSGCLSGINGKAALSCPFDKRRNGIILSEGAITLMIERLEDALARKAVIYAEVFGIGSAFDPENFYAYNPQGTGMISAMQDALHNAQIEPKGIDCIFANANSTHDADRIETKAIKTVFADYADKIPVTAVKSTLGETLSPAGLFSAAAAIDALRSGIIPPTINYQEKDAGCDLSYVVNQAQSTKARSIMINAFSYNGENTSLIIGKYS